jgi:predicted RNA-binding Zn ribbon-like protein
MPFAFQSAHYEMEEREAGARHLAERITQLFETQKQSAVQRATDNLNQLKEQLPGLKQLASKPKSIGERLFT